MWASDDAFGIRDGLLILSKNPSLKVEQDRLVVRDGYRPGADHGNREPHQLRLTRAECARGRLRHIVIIGDAGWVSNAAHLWLRDVGCALSLIEPGGNVIFSTGERGPDRPWLRRQQALVGVGVAPGAVAIARSLLLVKLAGQAAVLRLMNADAAANEIVALEGAMRTENDPARVLLLEAKAATVYWGQWDGLSVTFARQRPGGLTKNGKWRESLSVPDHWLRFGQRSSLLTGRPWRASDPANACLNLAYALLRCEMTIALVGRALDCGLGLFHSDEDRRPSLALDAMEPVRPLADVYVASFLARSSFLLRDFSQTDDGELRLSHPLRQHLGRCATVFREPCERIAAWLVRAFEAAGRMERVEDAGAGDLALITHVQFVAGPPMLPVLSTDIIDGGFFGPRDGYRGRWRLPKSCAECGRALGGQRKFCSPDCSMAFHMAHEALSETGLAALAAARPGLNPENKSKAGTRIAHENRRHMIARRAWDARHTPGEGLTQSGPRTPTPAQVELRQWYVAELQPRIIVLRNAQIMQATGLSRRYAIMIRRGFIPHPRHFAVLAELAGITVSKGRLFAAGS